MSLRLYGFLPKFPLQVQNDLAVIIRATGADIELFSKEDELFNKLSQRNMLNPVVITDATQCSVLEKIGARFSNVTLAIIVQENMSKIGKKLIEIPSVQSMIALHKSEIDTSDVILMLNQLHTPKLIGINAYLHPSIPVWEHNVFSHVDKKDVIERIKSYINYLGGPDSHGNFQNYSRLIANVADELLLHAVYYSNPRFQQSPQDISFKLNFNEALHVSWGFDGEIFALNIRDQFGTLTRKKLLDYLSLLFDKKQSMRTDAITIGMTTVFNSAHRLVFNVSKDLFTEIICVFRMEQRLIEFERRTSSFHFFYNQK